MKRPHTGVWNIHTSVWHFHTAVCHPVCLSSDLLQYGATISYYNNIATVLSYGMCHPVCHFHMSVCYSMCLFAKLYSTMLQYFMTERHKDTHMGVCNIDKSVWHFSHGCVSFWRLLQCHAIILLSQWYCYSITAMVLLLQYEKH